MNRIKLSWKTLCVALFLLMGLVVVPQVHAEEQSGEVTGVNLVESTIQLNGDLTIHVSDGSRLFDRDDRRMDLNKLSKLIAKPDKFGGRDGESIPYAYYTLVEASGKSIVEELHIRELEH